MSNEFAGQSVNGVAQELKALVIESPVAAIELG